MPDCLAIIPARGGSKGVPRKNLRRVAGCTLVGHSIRVARAAERVTRVVVSTDDKEIADVARSEGAEVVMRPTAIAGDTATSESALIHCLEELERTEGYRPELVMMVQCTSPLTIPADMDGAVDALLSQGADSAFTAVPFHHFVWKRGADGEALGVNHEGQKRKRRQDLEPELLENGAVYVMRAELFRKTQERFCGKTAICQVAPERALEIDDPRDLELADALLKRAGEARQSIPAGLAALILDFDGVLTDNRVLVGEDGTEAVLCSRSDGMGLAQLGRSGVSLLILSKERNSVVTARAKKLGIECLQGIDDKPTALAQWLSKQGLEANQCAFVGNDINDVACMKMVGFSACPADAHAKAKAASDLILTARGGYGAVRELCDLLLELRAHETAD